MSDEQEVLKVLLKNGTFDNEEQKVTGIAQLTVDRGYEHLSPLQKRVVDPFLTRACDGVTNPGGHHNNCRAVLQGAALVTGLMSAGYYSGVLCENCINETEQYGREWDRIQAE